MATKERVVFLVDDDPMHSQMLRDHLKNNLKVNITTFPTGEDMLNNLNQKPDVIVLDYYLNSVNPNAANGIEILQRVKKESPNTEVVMLSGQDKIDVAVETMKHGAFDYVIKNESAFLRTENIAYNIFKNFRLRENLSIYRFGFFLLLALIIIIIGVAIWLEATGRVNLAGGVVL